jgi:hypothetical protein
VPYRKATLLHVDVKQQQLASTTYIVEGYPNERRPDLWGLPPVRSGREGGITAFWTWHDI